ncbi:TauD/TfdA family dioxygenase [Embleya sp. NPDC008237]|uniref:TauD/TfdA family dioxygenase n=1 Tax=Embleya sp. NPDC008237 TaxID=3363978 RepID=UPI0036EE7553
MPTPLPTPAAPRALTPAFPDLATGPAAPVPATSWNLPRACARAAIVADYRERGHAIVQVPGPPPTENDLVALARALDLGPAFTPPMYTTGAHTAHTAHGVSRIAAAPDAAHPFQDRAGQNVHTDGTLQRLGEIPTTIMMCAHPAATGGSTLLFNVLAAYAELAAHDPAAASQLAHPQALVRASTFVEGVFTTGPAFGRDAHGIAITRYSRTATDSYRATRGGEADLARALAHLEAAARPGSRHRLDFTLAAGQALILANDRLCHGRTPYRDTDEQPHRLILRGLFTTRPTA